MPLDERGERTEAATPRRRQDARKEGKVAKSQELSSALVLLSGACVLYLFGGSLLNELVGLMRLHLGESLRIELTPARAHGVILDTTVHAGMALAPFMAVVMAVAYLSNLVQVGFLTSSTALTFKWERLNPAMGLKRLLSPKRALVEALKSPLKVALVGYVVYQTLARHSTDIPRLVDMDPAHTMSWLGRLTFQLAIRVSLAFLALAVLDYGYQRWQHEKQLRMSREEVKEEMKRTEGNPAVKGRIRSLQRQAAMHRMMGEVPKADVVVTNPVHFAVALRYDSAAMSAPRVVAKGARLVAEKIVTVARDHGIPIVQDPPLARALYKAGSIGHEIPIHLYRAVAEILAYVYRLAWKRRGAP
jgi:flagellar biosynthetic protein FlhB